MGRSLSGGVETVHWASLDEWGAELPGGRDAGAGGLWAGLEGLCGPGGGWSAGPRAHSPASRAFLSPDPEAPDASDPATAAAYSYAEGSPLSMVDPSGGRATPAQGGWDEQSWRATQARRAVAAGVRDVAEFAGILDRHTESYSELVCGVIARGQRTTYTVNPHGVLNVAGMIPGPVGFAADVANTGLYVWEGDWAGAGMSAAPRVFDIFRAGRAASSSTRFASRGDDMARAATRGEGFASRTWSRAKYKLKLFGEKADYFVHQAAGKAGWGTGTVWDRIIKPAAPVADRYTWVPEHFTLRTRWGHFWTNPNATKHMTESVHWLGGGLSGPIRSQMMLTSYAAAVDAILGRPHEGRREGGGKTYVRWMAARHKPRQA